MQSRLTFLLALVLLGGCATVRDRAASPSITIERDERPGYWRATYALAVPTRELVFERTPFRAGAFEVLTPGYVLERSGDTEVLRTDGEPAQRVVVRFPEDTRELEKEYDFFQKFTDGSVAIYTGHLAVRTGSDAMNADCTGCALRTFRFVPPAGQHVIAGGNVVRGTAEWRDEIGQGAYVYIGSITPLETNDFVSVVDPGLPPWLWDETRETLPRLFRLYAERLGELPAERPIVLFNYADRGGSGYSMGGGTLPGQIQLTTDGAEWKKRSEEALLQLLHFLAHESAHLWNGQLIHYDGTADAWMHEGSADALTQRLLSELGHYSRGDFYDRQSRALNDCRRGLREFPLRDAAARNAFSLYYSCGNALALFTEKSLPEGDLFAFWKSLIARVRGAGRATYAPADYYAAMIASGASEESVAKVRRFVEENATGDALTAMLQSTSLHLTESEPEESWGQAVARDALFRLLGEHCTGPYGFTAVREGLSLTKTNQCGPIPAGVVVTAIGGHDVHRDGASTWNELHERCGTELPVRLTILSNGESTTAEVKCGKPVAAPTTYLRISDAR